MNNIVLPNFDENSFTCPHCGVYSQFFPFEVIKDFKGPLKINRSGIFDEYRTVYPSDFFEFFDKNDFCIRVCTHCEKPTFWHSRTLVYPASSGIVPSKYMPEHVINDFQEAQAIVNLSPRAACSLLRYCLEQIINHLGGRGKRLVHKIDSLNLSPKLKRICDACRLTGNEASHNDNFDFQAKNEEAQALAHSISYLINVLCEEEIGINEMSAGIINRMQKFIK